jgi:hypothetical protein
MNQKVVTGINKRKIEKSRRKEYVKYEDYKSSLSILVCMKKENYYEDIL